MPVLRQPWPGAGTSTKPRDRPAWRHRLFIMLPGMPVDGCAGRGRASPRVSQERTRLRATASTLLVTIKGCRADWFA
jgi:hypothetical protein